MRRPAWSQARRGAAEAEGGVRAGAGGEAGFKRGLVYRARKALEGVVVDTEEGRAPGSRWALAREACPVPDRHRGEG